jgi:hypothetical protein
VWLSLTLQTAAACADICSELPKQLTGTASGSELCRTGDGRRCGSLRACISPAPAALAGALKGPSDLSRDHDKCLGRPDDYTEPDLWHQRPRRFGRRGSRAEGFRAEGFRAVRSLGGALRIGSATRTRKSSSVPRAG